MKRQIGEESGPIKRATTLLVLGLLVGLSWCRISLSQVTVTQEDVFAGKRPKLESLNQAVNSAQIGPLIIRTEPDQDPPAPDEMVGKSWGYLYEVHCKSKTYRYDYVGSVQVAEKIETALIGQNIVREDGTMDLVISYYHPLDSLLWRRTLSNLSEGTAGGLCYLSPSGYVVDFNRYEGKINFINSAGAVYRTHALYRPNVDLGPDEMNYGIHTGYSSQGNGTYGYFSNDGRIFVFVMGLQGVPEFGSGTEIIAFSDSGEIRFKKKVDENSPSLTLVAPNGERILVCVNSLGRGKYRNQIPGMTDAAGYLLSREGSVIKRIDVLCGQAAFSETGQHLMIITNRLKSALLLDASNGQEIRRFTPDDKNILGLALHENPQIVGLVFGRTPDIRDDQLDIKFFTFENREIGVCTLTIPDHRVLGGGGYLFQFNHDGTKFAFSAKDRIYYGNIGP